MSKTVPNDDENDLVVTTVRLTRKQKDYLDKHGEINLSGFVRRKIDEAIALEGE